MPDQCACIEIVDYRYAGALQKFIGFRVRSPIARDVRPLTYREALDIRPLRFAIFGAGAVVPDLRIGENHNLAGIRRIGEDLLVAGEGGVENDFAGPLGGRTKTAALEDSSVFQSENRGVQARMFLPRTG